MCLTTLLPVFMVEYIQMIVYPMTCLMFGEYQHFLTNRSHLWSVIPQLGSHDVPQQHCYHFSSPHSHSTSLSIWPSVWWVMSWKLYQLCVKLWSQVSKLKVVYFIFICHLDKCCMDKYHKFLDKCCMDKYHKYLGKC